VQARARQEVTEWRDQHPGGSYDEMVAALLDDFPNDYSPALRGMLYAVDRHQAHQITGVSASPDAARPAAAPGPPECAAKAVSGGQGSWVTKTLQPSCRQVHVAKYQLRHGYPRRALG
jgi:hypothetical protein